MIDFNVLPFQNLNVDENGSQAFVFAAKSDKKKAIQKPPHHLLEVEVTHIVVSNKISSSSNNNKLRSQRVEKETVVWFKILDFRLKQVPQRKHIVPLRRLVHHRFVQFYRNLK